MITGILAFIFCGFLIGGLILFFASRTAPGAVRRERIVKYSTYLLIVAAFCVTALAGRLWLRILMIVLLSLGAVELVRLLKQPSVPIHRRILGSVLAMLVYFLLGVGLLLFVELLPPETMLFVYLVTATFDGFSQVCGQLMGKRPLAPGLSPNKTVEGLAGGIAAGCLAAVILGFLPGLRPIPAIMTSIVICMGGLTGDLSASWIKRLHRAKDFGTLIPGHGGILDRFDSFFFAAPAYMLLHLLTRY
jgi:phosphatidate cytidylyltransferase